MTILPLKPAENASREALMAFLATCRQAALRDAHPKLASITLAVDALDPLAVLESIFDPLERHFYAERPQLETAIAGAETVLMHTASGPTRFSDVQQFIAQTLEHTLAVGDLDAPFAGPHFFSTFAFEDELSSGEPFPAAQVFVPRWQVARAGATTTAVANVLVAPDSDLSQLAERVWRAHQKFSSFDYAANGDARIGAGQVSAPKFRVTEVGDYRSAVANGLQEISQGRLQKIVLARAQDLSADRELHPLRVLNGLRQRFPECYAFSVGNGDGQSFIGASPERLVRVSKGLLQTEALAGSTRRGQSASEDAGLAAALLQSEKDLREHRLVIDSMVRRLAPLGIVPEVASRPVLRRLANVQHLYTPVTAPLPEGVTLLDALSVLHPTPAVGGTPRVAAVARIQQLEQFTRGLYAGALGWLNPRGGGEFFVGIRSALISGEKARVYAGAGIVAGSKPEQEFLETELKFRALLEALSA